MAPTVVDPNGEFHVEQLYVQHVKLAKPEARYPLLPWHGGGHTGAPWGNKTRRGAGMAGSPGWGRGHRRATSPRTFAPGAA